MQNNIENYLCRMIDDILYNKIEEGNYDKYDD